MSVKRIQRNVYPFIQLVMCRAHVLSNYRYQDLLYVAI